MKVLYFDHNIFLNKKQRYDLYSGAKVFTIGKYTLIKDSEKFKKTNHLYEVPCLYKIIPKKNVYKTIKKSFNGFDIYLTKKSLQNSFLDIIKNYFFAKNNQKEIIKNILDIKDGGVEQIFLEDQEYKKGLNIKHKILIQKKELLIA